MPFARRRHSRRRTSGSNKKRGTIWDWNGYFGVATPGGLFWDWMIFPAISEANLRSSTNLGIDQLREDFTLVKTIIDFTAQEIQSGTDSDSFYIGLTTFRSSDPSTTPAINEIPQPSDGSEEWIWRQPVLFPKNITGGGIVTIASLLDPNKSIMRGMRKLPENTGVIVVVDTQQCLNSVAFNSEFRFLLKKPR